MSRYFAADDSVVYHRDGTATYNRELFRTDGTAEGTYRVKDINPGFEPSTPTDFIRYNHFVFFSANDGLHVTTCGAPMAPRLGRSKWRT